MTVTEKGQREREESAVSPELWLVAARATIRVVEARAERWKRRAVRFREALADERVARQAFELQKMQLEAMGADAVCVKQRAAMKERMMTAVRERNEARVLLADRDATIADLEKQVRVARIQVEEATAAIRSLRRQACG